MRIDYNDLEIVITSTGHHDYYYNGEIYTGIAFEKNEEGLIIGETTFKKGIISGLLRTWHSNGILEIQTNYHTGHKHGESKEWYENGKLKKKETYDFGTLFKSEEFDEEGNLIKKYDIKTDRPESLESHNDWKEMLRKKGFSFD